MQVNLDNRTYYSQIIKQGKDFLNHLRKHFTVVNLKEQQSTQELIHRLELAINLQKPVTIQMNASFDQEDIEDFHGLVFQTPTGFLFIRDLKDTQLKQLSPELLRHISFS